MNAYQGGGEDKTNLFFDTNLFRKLFPNLSQYFNEYHAAILLATTRIVGMSVPGIHSIFSELNLKFPPQAHISHQSISYTFKKHHILPCFHIKLENIDSKIIAFIRPIPISNQTLHFLSSKYPKLDFSNQNALIIGGSKGLGNTCAKLLALGGANVLVGYNSTKFDEEHDKISSFHINICKTLHHVKEEIETFNPTHLYYFSTPPIQATKGENLNQSILLLFIQHYIFGLDNILKLKLSNLRTIFIPSTIFCEELPQDFKEYVLAKQMVENFCHFLSKEYQIISPRLPKTQTNQTLELIKHNLPSPDEILLPLLPN